MDTKTIVRRFYDEVVNQGKVDTAEEVISTDVRDHGVPPMFPPGRAGFLEFAASLKVAFPDLHVTVDDLIAEGNQVAARVTVRGTHRGTLLGRLSATGKAATWPGIDIFRIADGKIVERWNVRDLLSLLEQLGVEVGI